MAIDKREVARATRDQRVRRRSKRRFEQIGEMRWMHQVVVVVKEHPVAGRGGDARIACSTRPASGLVPDEFYCGKLRGQHRKRVIRRPIVDDHNFLVLQRLGLGAEKRAPQQRRAVARRYDDADSASHGSPTPNDSAHPVGTYGRKTAVTKHLFAASPEKNPRKLNGRGRRIACATSFRPSHATAAQRRQDRSRRHASRW